MKLRYKLIKCKFLKCLILKLLESFREAIDSNGYSFLFQKHVCCLDESHVGWLGWKYFQRDNGDDCV